MLTRFIIRARVRGAIKHRNYINGLILQRTADAESLHPESLERVLIEREIMGLLKPQLEHEIKLIDELNSRLEKR